ncbi:DUF4374 domain-containing protein [Proteiniphilum acetatigenes]|uniref:DUF4374 domain-containing protein n=1 Tax=Proteiniphilum acetatigenes TaxID=294710 RepID=UPI00035E9A6C|nr:DUF4374 domain-containing protein [Proteiniphilum acetatigenes]SDZ75076.1 protein of unknown function [Porphyromonadaceae bacterium KH3R12]
MKSLQFLFKTFLIATAGLLSFACSDGNGNDNPDDGVPTPEPFNIWVSLGGGAGMGSTASLIVKGLKSLDGTEIVDFKGSGLDVTAKMDQESIIKAPYYYQIPKEKDRFGKYIITNERIVTVKEVAFGSNTYKDRRYTHAWINKNTLVIMAANGDASKVIWTKLDAENMTIISEGTLEFPASAPEIAQFSTSGIASFRAGDGKILYSYLDNKDKERFHLAFINPSDMKVEKVITEERAEMMAGTAYGELLQSKSFFDTNGDYYLACNTVNEGATSTTQQHGSLVRIKNGQTEFDKDYFGYITPSSGKGKIVTAELLTSGKALLYVMDPEYTGADGWGADYNCYYAILDLKTDRLERLGLPHSSGNFSQRSVVIGNTAYIGVNPKGKGNLPCVYSYDIPTGTMKKTISIEEGYDFSRIVALN